jgi:Dihydrodipicolinate synthetase family
VMALPPNIYRADEGSVVDHFRAISAVGLPVMAYNNPFDTKVDLVPELLARLFGEGYIVAVKDFSGDPRRAYAIKELAPDLDVLVGSDDTVLEMALAGAVGWVSGYTNANLRRPLSRVDGPRRGHGPTALSTPPRPPALGRADRVRPGHQAVNGHRRSLRRPVSPAARSAQ